MTGEGSEYGGEHREIDEDETDRIVREMIDEVRKETEEREASEAQEEHEEVKSPEECVREAIEEIRQKEEERERAMEEWEERQREREEQLEKSREEREEKADKDDFAELEERILENFDDYGIDPEEVKERWQERFEEEVKEQLDGPQNESETADGEDDEQAGDEGRTAEDEVYYTDSSGQVHVVKTESDETAESKAEPSIEVQEQSEESVEVPDTPESQGTELEVEEGEVTPQDERSSQTQEGAVEYPYVRECEEENEEIEKQFLESESKEVVPEREKTVEESDNPHPETESSLDVDEPVEVHEQKEKLEPQSEESGGKLDSSTEVDTEHQEPQKYEHQNSEESSETDTSSEGTKEEPESREEEIWTSYEANNGSIEDEEWKRYLRELFNTISEEEREEFKEYLREQVQTIEEFEELLRKYGLEELLEEKDVMEEVRQFLEFKQALEANPERSVEEIAEELGLDAEQALEWSRGESEPMSLRKLLNLEAYYLWDQIIRSYRERDYPKTREALEHSLAERSELRSSRFLSIEREEALAWIEIIGMRRRGEIRKKIRNGREIYSREQIYELSKKYRVTIIEIIKWLRGEKAPYLVEKLVAGIKKKQIAGSAELKQNNTTRNSAQDNGIIANNIDKKIHRLYFEEELTQREIAKKLSIPRSRITTLFKNRGWKSRPARPPRKEVDIEKVRRLYFDEGLSQKDVAEKIGLRSTRPVQRIFKKMGWKPRGKLGDGVTYRKRVFHSKEERDLAKKERNQKNQQRLKRLREKMFGTECKICGISTQKKTIVIHRKDFKEHNPNTLWIKAKLQTLDPKNWVALCVHCHRMVHWLNSNFNSNWQDIEKYLDRKKSLDSQIKKPLSSSSEKETSNRYKEVAERANGDVKELRKLLFGNECHFCKDSNDKRRLVIHRKDGKSHNWQILWAENKLKYLNPDEWVVLCQKCHRYVHWAEEKLGLAWNDLRDL